MGLEPQTASRQKWNGERRAENDSDDQTSLDKVQHSIIGT